MRYLSLFSGIGGFEVAIHQVFGNKAECVAFSEIDKHAIAEYERHYPKHKNLGDVTQIKKKDIDALGKIDLIVGGFPCNDLSSAKHKGRQGLDGEKSGLFWVMIKILKWARKNNPELKILVENNASMAHKWRDMITSELMKVFKRAVFCNFLDSRYWVVQRRRRYYWTLQKIPFQPLEINHMIENPLDPQNEVKEKRLSEKMIGYLNKSPAYLNQGNLKKNNVGEVLVSCKKDKERILFRRKKVPYQTRLCLRTSSTRNSFIRAIDTTPHIILDYRFGSETVPFGSARRHEIQGGSSKSKDGFVVRYLTKNEYSKVFGYPKDYIATESLSVFARLYGMTVVPPVIRYILQYVV